MRVLLISHVFPYPPIDGEVLPIFHFLRELAPRVHFHLVTQSGPDPAVWNEGRKLFEQWGIKVQWVENSKVNKLFQAWACLRGGHLWVNRFYRPAFANLCRHVIAQGEWDVIQAEGIMSAQHLPPPPWGKGSLLMARDCLSLAHWRRWKQSSDPKQLLQWAKIRSMEAGLLRKFDRVAAISPIDGAALARISPQTPVELIPNGVDLQSLRPRPELRQPGTVVFSGAMDSPANDDAALWMGREIWPRLRETVSSARLLIVGRGPSAEVRALAEDPSIIVTGKVENMADWLARAEVIVSPLRLGTGIKNKILEGAAMGQPIVATPLSLEGMDLRPGQDLLLADTAQAFAARVAELLADPEARHRLGANARTAAEAGASWTAAADRLFAVYERLALARKGGN